jgi:hypothetical protein
MIWRFWTFCSSWYITRLQHPRSKTNCSPIVLFPASTSYFSSYKIYLLCKNSRRLLIRTASMRLLKPFSHGVSSKPRSLFAPARGTWLVPDMPAGTKQFVNATADVGTAPVAQSQARVLWHGTSISRLFRITTEGLRVMSGTVLQAHGAASGSGVYLSEEPATSWAYSGGLELNRPGSSFNGMRILLGVQYTAPGLIGRGVQVVTDVKTLKVRHLFMIPSSQSLPPAARCAPAMLSMYKAIRSRDGVIGTV